MGAWTIRHGRRPEVRHQDGGPAGRPVPGAGRQRLVVLGDKGYLGEDDIHTPSSGRNKPAWQKEANRAHARLRAAGERANAQIKSWRILRKLRCCPWRAGRLAKAIHVLQACEIGG